MISLPGNVGSYCPDRVVRIWERRLADDVQTDLGPAARTNSAFAEVQRLRSYCSGHRCLICYEVWENYRPGGESLSNGKKLELSGNEFVKALDIVGYVLVIGHPADLAACDLLRDGPTAQANHR